MSSIAPFPDPLVKRLQAIAQLISAGKLPAAADKLNAAQAAAPRDPRVYLLGIRLAEASGNAAAAQEAARHAVRLSPQWPVAIMELAFLLARQNQLKEAIVFAEQGVALDGNNPAVLARAIDIAHRAQHFDLALAWLQRAAAVSPDHSDIQLLLARDLRIKGQHDKAMAIYDRLIAAAPSDRLALMGRVQTALARGDRALALQDCDTLLALAPGNEEVLYQRALALGETPARLPATMVRALYDTGFAELYDQHVVAGLKYKLPREVARRLSEESPGLKLNVLDLGCGTGLLGACLGRLDGALVGVDLSSAMIEQAARHQVYDKFHNVDLLDALEATPGSLYDVIAALDVFIYAGDMKAAIPDAFRILRPGGQFIFSCESAGEGEPDLVLRDTRRYAHRRSAVEAMCRSAGFEPVEVEAMDLRYEEMQPVAGFLVRARKPA